jgi:catechol-2,3-dioxygenase
MTGIAPVVKPGWLEMTSPNVDAMVDHYVRVMGFQVVEHAGTSVYLGLNSDHHSLVIHSGAANGRSAVGFKLAGEVKDNQRRLRDAGIDAELRSDSSPGIEQALAIIEPGTGTPILLYEGMEQTHSPTIPGPQPTKLGHVASFAPDLAESQSFFTDVLGFRWSDTIGDFFTFLRCNSDHHAVNIMASTKRTGLHHVAFETRDINHLKTLLDHFAREKVRLTWGMGRHGPGHNLFSYHEDPDGNLVEAFTEADVILDEKDPQWEPRPWHEDFPLGPRFWPLEPATANQWGLMDPTQVDH